MAYSTDLRIRVLDFIMKGNTIQSASKNFSVHHNTIGEWLRAFYEEDRLIPKEPYRQAPYKVNWESLDQFVKLNPDLTQAEYAKHFDVSQGQICKIFKKLNITYKKKTFTYQEQDPEEVKEFSDKFEKIEDKSKIVYLDESAINHRVMKEYGYSPRGHKLFGKAQGKRIKKLNIIAGLCGKQIIAPFACEINVNTDCFNFYLETKLLPSLGEGHVIIMDNARYHLSTKTEELIKNKKCEILYLPKYSPELNKIENYWAVFKKYIRKNYEYFKTLEEMARYVFSYYFSSILTTL